MSKYFIPYSGKKNYVFISYSHSMSERVLDIISKLNDDGYRIWYDEGIPAGSNWPKAVEQRLRASKKVLFFLSESSLASENCYSEILTASELGIPVLCCKLQEDIFIEEKWNKLLTAAVFVSEDNIESYVDADFIRSPGEKDNSVGLGIRRINWWGISAVASALLLIVSAVSAYLSFSSANDSLSEVTEVKEAVPAETIDVSWGNLDSLLAIDFPDVQQKKAVNSFLGKDIDDNVFEYELDSITELYFCGHTYVDSPDRISVVNDDGNYKYVIVSGSENSNVVKGNISNLSVISKMAFLERLYLVDQKVSDISYLYGLTNLKELSIASCNIDSLYGISGLNSLDTLHIEHTLIKDLEPLSALPSLKKVTVSEEMLPLSIPSQNFEVVLVR